MNLHDFEFNLPIDDEVVYDIETYPNLFGAHFRTRDRDREWYFELSPWRDNTGSLIRFMNLCRKHGIAWTGFNNMGFDYPVMHFVYFNPRATVGMIYDVAMAIINTPYEQRFSVLIPEFDHVVRQIDLMKVHHFDNVAKATSLKVLEFNMEADHVQELPFPVGTVLTEEQAKVVREYNRNDTGETKRFRIFSQPSIAMRYKLEDSFSEFFMNCSDVKIGEKLLAMKLKEQGVKLFGVVDGRKRKLQTKRDVIKVSDIIFPYVRMESAPFHGIHSQLHRMVIPADNTKGVFTDMVTAVGGVEYKFGTGGLHGSVEQKIIRSTDEYQLIDVDVASYYPNLAIKNRLYPEHLGEKFCDAYETIYYERKQHPKGTPENEAFKLALNGSYGNSNNKFSALYDPQYTMSITINGQLLLAMLIEQLVKTPGLKMIQANTDGVTYLCPRPFIEHTRKIAQWWMDLTQLELEENFYSAMFVRDVNSYIAVTEEGKVKRIGAYAYETAMENPGTRELPWHKDWSFRIVAMAAEEHLLRGTDLRTYIENRAELNPYLFFGRTKVPKTSSLELGGERVPNIVRYFISNSGKKLEKVMPPAGPAGQFKRASKLTDQFYREVMAEIGEGVWDERIHTKNRSVYEERRTEVEAGWLVEVLNEWSTTGWEEAESAGADHGLDINIDYYFQRAEKLVNLREFSGSS